MCLPLFIVIEVFLYEHETWEWITVQWHFVQQAMNNMEIGTNYCSKSEPAHNGFVQGLPEKEDKKSYQWLDGLQV